jgi:membrane fusion protein, macrolide-specific efflux system
MKKIMPFVKSLFQNRIRAAFVIVGIIGVSFILFKSFGTKKNTVQVQTQAVEKGTIVSSISVSGQIISSNIININSSANGLVKNVFVKDGDKVYAGQKIAELTLDSDAQQKATAAYTSYLSAKSNLDSANVSLWSLDSQMFAANQKFINDAVARDLATNDPTYIQEHDDWLAAEAKYKNQQNVIAQAKLSLGSSWLSYQSLSPVIYAPLSGVITNITLVPGMSVSSTSSQRVAVLKSEGTPLASFDISEIDVSKVKAGQKATVTLDSISGKTFTGTVVSIDKIGTVTSGVTSYPAIIKFDTNAPEILPNMSSTANIILQTKSDVLIVPSTAVKQTNGQYTIVVVKGTKQETINVEVGLTSDSQTEITSGLSEGDIIVTSQTTSSTTTGSSSTKSVFGGSSFGGVQRVIGR